MAGRRTRRLPALFSRNRVMLIRPLEIVIALSLLFAALSTVAHG